MKWHGCRGVLLLEAAGGGKAFDEEALEVGSMPLDPAEGIAHFEVAMLAVLEEEEGVHCWGY